MPYLRNQVAKIAKINVETLRYYERNGVLPSPIRDENGYRQYSNDTIEKLETIKHAKECGFTLEEIKKILAVVENETIDYKNIAEFINEKISDIDQRISRLNNMKEVLNKIIINIDAQAECPIKTTFENL